MKKKIVIFRHGETDFNKEKRMQGSGVDCDLNRKGVAQAQELIPILKNHGVEVVYSSPMKRALSTTYFATQPLDIPIKIYPALHEANLGVAEGLLFSEIKEKYGDVWSHWFTPNDYMDIRFPGGESKGEICQRLMDAVLDIAEHEEAEIIGISTHGAAIRSLLMPLGRFDEPMKNGEVFIVEYENGLLTLIK